MKNLSSLTTQILAKSLIAFAVYPLVSSFVSYSYSRSQDDHVDYGDPMSLKTPFLQAQDFVFGNLLKYFAFLLVMLVIDGPLKAIFKLFGKTNDITEEGIHPIPEAPWKKGFVQTMIVSAAVCGFYHILIEGLNPLLCSGLATSPLFCKTQLLLPQGDKFSRLLEDVEPIYDDYEQPQDLSSTEKISLSMGRVLSSMNLNANHIVVTKDTKYAYVILVTGGLRVIDISNLAAPNIVKTLSLPQPSSLHLSSQKFMHLSPDEKILFISCFEALQIVNITNPESAYMLGYSLDVDFHREASSFGNFNLPVSFVLSADSKTLFVGCLGLQTFDVSDLEHPRLLNSQLNIQKNELLLLTVAATDDRKTLWVANGTLDSYNISDARNMKLINSFSEKNMSINSLILSRDNKTAFALSSIGTEKIQITKMDIWNSSSPKKTESVTFAQVSYSPAWIVSLSPKDRYIFIAFDVARFNQRMVLFDLIEKKVLTDDPNLLANMKTVTLLSPRENCVIASGALKTTIIEFYKNFPNREIFSLTDYPKWTFEMKRQFNLIDFTKDEKHFIVESYDESGSDSVFEIYDFQNKTSPNLLGSFGVDFIPWDLIISGDLRRAAVFNAQNLSFLDVSNMKAPSSYSTFQHEEYADIEDVAFWSESDIVFIVTHTYRTSRSSVDVLVMDFYDPKSPLTLSKLTLASGFEQTYKMAFSQDKKLLFLAGPSLIIYNISDVRNMSRISSINITTAETDFVDFVQVSHDGKKCFVETVDRTSFHKLKIYNTSDLRNPKLASELVLPMHTKKYATVETQLSTDSKTLYLLQKRDILAIDVSNIRAPRVFGLLPINNIYQEDIAQSILSGDSQIMYIVTKNGTIDAMSLKVPQTLYLNQEDFYLGQHYSEISLVLKSDGGTEYSLIKDSEYKILKVGVFEVKVEATAETTTSGQLALPGWANFDQANKALTLEARKQSDLGHHTLVTTISNKVYAPAFSFLDPPGLNVVSTQMVSDLVRYGYLDKQHFLMPELGSLEDFYIGPRIQDKERIFRILNEHYFVTCTTINILPSLRVEFEAENILISSLNANFIKINIQLEDTTHAKFLKRPYGLLVPVISNSKSHLMIEGSLKDVNSALKNLTINLESIENCHAEMTVIDDMNPLMTVNISDVKRFFRINQAPYPNPKKQIQRQINMVPIYTGQYFTITLDRNTILDKNVDILNYKVVSKGGEANDTAPSWLTFEDLTIRGTAPEELINRDIEFTLIAWNEFKRVEVPFTLHLKISSNYVAKLIMRYSPYILTILGLYIQANKISNVLRKKSYRHKKDIFVEIGKEIGKEIIYPIAFIQQEKIESEIIWGILKKKIPQSEVMGDKEKIVRLIEEIVDNDIPKEKKKNLKIYLRGVEYRKKIIDQLIINKLVYLQLNSEEEKSTKREFEKLKDQWPELVYWNPSSESFKVNTNKLYATLVGDGIKDSENLQESLLLKPNKVLGVNLNLLSHALEGYTFDCHSLDRRAIRLNIELKEKTEKNRIQSFFKLDIESINHKSQLQSAYGISWSIENDSLVFSGVPCENFKDKTLVIEIANAQHKVLKEIWIHEKDVFNVVEKSSRNLKKGGEHYNVL